MYTTNFELSCYLPQDASTNDNFKKDRINLLCLLLLHYSTQIKQWCSIVWWVVTQAHTQYPIHIDTSYWQYHILKKLMLVSHVHDFTLQRLVILKMHQIVGLLPCLCKFASISTHNMAREGHSPICYTKGNRWGDIEVNCVWMHTTIRIWVQTWKKNHAAMCHRLMVLRHWVRSVHVAPPCSLLPLFLRQHDCHIYNTKSLTYTHAYTATSCIWWGHASAHYDSHFLSCVNNHVTWSNPQTLWTF